MKTKQDEGKGLARRYIKDWAKYEDESGIHNDILEFRESERIVTLLLCTGGPHLELALIFDEDELIFGVWTYKDWGTCDRWIASDNDMKVVEKHFSYIPELHYHE